MAYFLYLSQLKDQQISCYRIDPQSGELQIQGHTATLGEPSALGPHPRRRILYAAMRSSGALCSFAIDPQSGELRLLHSLDTGLEDPAYIATDRSGRHLITPYYASGAVTVYAIGDDGIAAGPLVSRLDTAPHAHGIAVDPHDRYVFVPHTCPGNAVWQLLLKDGQLTPNQSPRVTFDRDVGPRHLHLHPTNGCAYADNEQGNSVTAFRFDAASGTLQPFQELPTVPADHPQSACARLELHPSGRFLYAANRGHDSLAAFAIAPDGSLTPTGHFSTPPTPRSFHIEPQGRFLYAAGEAADQLATYRIDPQNGALTPLRTYDTGHVPWWVQIVETG